MDMHAKSINALVTRTCKKALKVLRNNLFDFMCSLKKISWTMYCIWESCNILANLTVYSSPGTSYQIEIYLTVFNQL